MSGNIVNIITENAIKMSILSKIKKKKKSITHQVERKVKIFQFSLLFSMDWIHFLNSKIQHITDTKL